VAFRRGNVIDKARSSIDGRKPAKINDIKDIKNDKARVREVAINNDLGLEKAADRMGSEAQEDPVTQIKTGDA
jgi:hypothetical protein